MTASSSPVLVAGHEGSAGVGGGGGVVVTVGAVAVAPGNGGNAVGIGNGRALGIDGICHPGGNTRPCGVNAGPRISGPGIAGGGAAAVCVGVGAGSGAFETGGGV